MTASTMDLERDQGDKDSDRPGVTDSTIKGNGFPEDWLGRYFKEQGITFDYKTDGLRKAGALVEPRVANAALRMAARSFGDKLIRESLADLLVLWKHAQVMKVLDDLRSDLAYKSSSSDLVGTWVEAATGKRDEFDLAVIRHFVWQVKRKLMGMSVEHHLMPILYGKSGAGKSVAVVKLLEPLEIVTQMTNMSVFGDRFGKRQFTRNYVMFFDELEGCGLVDVNRLKQVITSSVQEWRVMHSEGVHSAPQNCTFIGCTNDPVAERIKDPTSARRFWQLDCADKLDWAAINGLDYQALWQSVDESASCPILPYIDGIRKKQDNEVRAKDIIEQWLEQCCRPEPFGGESPTSSILFDYFRSWCRWQDVDSYPGFHAFSRGLAMRMKLLGWKVEPKHSNSGTIWPLAVSTTPGTEPT